jgi:YihY family inner membrane protein
MSSANPVPETTDLMTGERAMDSIRSAGAKTLMLDGLQRLRAADGFSHSRAMAFQLVLALIPGTIVLVALASQLRWESLSNAIIRTVEALAPGPTADVFREAFGQGEDAGSTESGWTALSVAGPALLIAGTTAFGQVERTANRIYGVEADRQSRQKYTIAALMMLSAGTLSAIYFLVVGLGGAWIGEVGESPWATAWWIGRWPIGLGLLAGALALVFKLSPRRRQPPMSWLAFGAVVAVAGSLLVTLLLTLYLNASEGFGETYGALAGFMGVLLWSYGSSIAVFYGLACAAQLEAFRAGVALPRDEAKVSESEPDAVVVPYGTAAMHPGGST